MMPIPTTCVQAVSAFIYHALPVSIDKEKSTPVISLVFSLLDLLSNFGRLEGQCVL